MLFMLLNGFLQVLMAFLYVLFMTMLPFFHLR